MTDHCIRCGAPAQGRRLVCPKCEASWKTQPDAILADGTPLYLKTRTEPTYASLQLYLYDLLNRRSK